MIYTRTVKLAISIIASHREKNVIKMAINYCRSFFYAKAISDVARINSTEGIKISVRQPGKSKIDRSMICWMYLNNQYIQGRAWTATPSYEKTCKSPAQLTSRHNRIIQETRNYDDQRNVGYARNTQRTEFNAEIFIKTDNNFTRQIHFDLPCVE